MIPGDTLLLLINGRGCMEQLYPEQMQTMELKERPLQPTFHRQERPMQIGKIKPEISGCLEDGLLTGMKMIYGNIILQQICGPG